MLETLRAVSKRLNTAMLWLGCLALLGMMALACVNMVTRAVWVPVKGSYEIVGFLGALVASFALGHTQEHKGHIALTILAGMFKRRTEKLVDAFANLLCAAFFGLAAWRTAVWAWSLVETGELSETLRMAYYPFPFAVALGLALLALALLCDAMEAWLAATGKRGAKKERSAA